MKQLTILSGKGGTGKTTLAACFAVLAKNVVVADCDVDAPDLHMLLHPQVLEQQKFKGSKLASIKESICTHCGLCKKFCMFNAITESFTVDGSNCEGCGVCIAVCPASAVDLVDRVSGNAFISKIPQGFMSHALLDPGESNSGKLVTLVRQNAKNMAAKEKINLIMIDGSPGIGCPVIASISGVDATLIVTEPTQSGIHDLKRVLKLARHFNVTPFVCINQYDINRENTEKIKALCRKNSITLLGTISWDAKVTEAMVNGKTVVQYDPQSKASQDIEKIWSKLCKLLEDKL